MLVFQNSPGRFLIDSRFRRT